MRSDSDSAERFSTALEHARLACGCRRHRKTLSSSEALRLVYKGAAGASELRQRSLHRIDAEDEAIFCEYLYGSARSLLEVRAAAFATIDHLRLTQGHQE